MASAVRVISRVAAALAVSALAVSLPAAQEPAGRATLPNWDAWFHAISTHEPGERDQAVTDIAPWSLRDLQLVLQNVPRLFTADQLGVVVRGVVLHADIAILHRVPGGYDLPAGPTTVVLLKDGRRVGQMASTEHWEFARRLLETMPKSDERARLGGQFYRAAAAVLQEWGEFPELTTHLAAGRKSLGEDPVLLLYEGTQQQAYAGPKLQQYLAERRAAEQRRPMPTSLGANQGYSRPPPPVSASPQPLLPEAAEARRHAERLFRRALALDPALVEARVRLAHVLSDLGRQDAAAIEIEAAMKTTPLPDFLEYYGALILGRVQRARQELDAARDAFQRAAAIVPEAPAPKFGLSDVAMARGDRAASLELLPRAIPSDVNEPWWSFERLHEPSADQLLDELRREARR
jgi:tetratricopeptide (TPR) repeat protein